ncbi:ABC transporter permease [Amycolatopsis sp.]|uniref:ABC transporter permease n=1 Tax=Amycolatopsis sp. TaxID=37632 RepID=UPI002E02B95F|nr:ABC transporter permease subunit [Amycolatopsis sp.]
MSAVEVARPVGRPGVVQLAGLSRKWLSPVAGIVILLAVWQLIAVTVAAGRHVVPTIPDVVDALVSDGFYVVHVQTTLWEATQGFFWGNLVAFAVAGVCLVAPPLRIILTRVAMATYSTPTIAVAPLLIVLFDPDQTKVVMAGLSVFFPTLLGTLLGLESAPKGAMEIAHVSGASRRFTVLRVQLRAAVVPIAGALSLAAPAAMVGAMIGEYLGGDTGLGAQLVQAQQALNVERAWAVAIEATALSTLAYLAIGAVARRLSYTDTSTEFNGAAPVRARGAGGWWWSPVRAVVSLTVVILLWFGLVKGMGLNPYLAKTPDQVWTYLVSGTDGSGGQLGEIVGQLLGTLRDAGIGYLAGTAAAVITAALFLSSPVLEGMFLPLVMTLRAVPLVAMTPIIALIFGRGLLTVAVLAGAVTFVPTLVIVLAALRAVPKPAIELAHVYGLGWFRSMFGVRMIYAVPALAASARVALPGSILGAVLVEILATGSGIGNVVAVSIGSSEYLTLWSALAVLTMVTALFYALLSTLESAALARLAQ